VSRLGGAQEVGRGHSCNSLTPDGQRDIPYHMTSCSAIKNAGGRRRKGEAFGVMVFVFPSHH